MFTEENRWKIIRLGLLLMSIPIFIWLRAYLLPLYDVLSYCAWVYLAYVVGYNYVMWDKVPEIYEPCRFCGIIKELLNDPDTMRSENYNKVNELHKEHSCD